MISLTIVALLRLIPYAVVLVIALRRNYPRLALAMIAVMTIAILNVAVPTSPEARAVMASVFALLLMMHALRLPPRGEGR